MLLKITNGNLLPLLTMSFCRGICLVNTVSANVNTTCASRSHDTRVRGSGAAERTGVCGSVDVSGH